MTEPPARRDGQRDASPGRGHRRKSGYERPTGWDETLRRVRELSARTVIFDIEPVVAYWDSGQEALDRGVASVVRQVAAVPGVQVVCFSTNSLRRPSQLPDVPGVRMVWLAAAGKPLRTAVYRDFPRPGVVIGDQVVTDGVLAWRLDYTFVQYRPELDRIPAGPWVMERLGKLIRPLLFTRRT
jgi:hypothetical protein